jgi:hypothetical protein
MRLGIALALAIISFATSVAADPPAPVLVTNEGAGRVRLLISEGHTIPCDSPNDTKIFEGWIDDGETKRFAIGGQCVCITHTSEAFAWTNWSTPGFVCRPRVWRGRRWYGAADPTIRISIVK